MTHLTNQYYANRTLRFDIDNKVNREIDRTNAIFTLSVHNLAIINLYFCQYVFLLTYLTLYHLREPYVKHKSRKIYTERNRSISLYYLTRWVKSRATVRWDWKSAMVKKNFKTKCKQLHNTYSNGIYYHLLCLMNILSKCGNIAEIKLIRN